MSDDKLNQLKKHNQFIFSINEPIMHLMGLACRERIKSMCFAMFKIQRCSMLHLSIINDLSNGPFAVENVSFDIKEVNEWKEVFIELHKTKPDLSLVLLKRFFAFTLLGACPI